jgi:hypothetical protein
MSSAAGRPQTRQWHIAESPAADSPHFLHISYDHKRDIQKVMPSDFIPPLKCLYIVYFNRNKICLPVQLRFPNGTL